jgi:outer membrane receptor protein involved in Fe transport
MDAFNPGVKRVKDFSDPTGQESESQALVYTDNNSNNQYDYGIDHATAGFVDKNGDNEYDPRVDRALAGKIGGEDYASAKTDYKISPRLSVSFPVSEKMQFRLSYGKFFQQPNLQDLYVSPDFLEQMSTSAPFFTSIGNPNLKAEESTQYEVGIRRALSDRVSLDLSAYYRDIENLVNTRNHASIPTQLTIADNLDEGVVKGVTLAIDVRRISKFNGRFSYTMQTAYGSGSNETSANTQNWLGYSDTKFNAPLSYDQRHTINGNMDVRNGKSEGPQVSGIYPLENAGMSFIISAGSGFPYTPMTVEPLDLSGVPSGRVIGRRNSQYGPWTFRIDMKADKTFYFASNMNLNVYIQILNLLNRKNVLNVFPSTGQPDNNGFVQEAAGTISQREIYQYDILYKDGLNWDTPRQARLGVIFNF